MRVAFDVAATRLARSGVARVALALAAAMEKRQDVQLVRVGGGRSAYDRGWRRRAMVAALDLGWHPVGGSRAAARAGAALYHCPSPRAPLTRGALPTIVTVHDLIALHHPDTMSRWNRVYTRATLRRVLAAADRVVAVSDDTAADLRQLFGRDDSRIRVVRNGVDHEFFGAPPGAPPVHGEYALFVGTPEPRKNLKRLLEAMALVRARGGRLRLVLAGSVGWGGVRLERSEEVVPLGRVDDEVLRALYAHASCLVLPSLHEGSGLPALEAMAAGCPVVAAAAGALPETCGGAAVLVDPLSVGSIAAGIESALGDGDRLAAAGRAHARMQGWERAADALAAVYRELT